MNRLIIRMKDTVRRRRMYFRQEKQRIAEENLSILKNASLVTIFLLILFLVLTPFILKGWHASTQHIVFVPITCLFAGVSVLSEKKMNITGKKSMLMCSLFHVMLLTFIILIDVFGDLSAPSTFMPVMCVAIPALFIMPISLSFSIVCGFSAVYIILVDRFKDAAIAYYDILNVLVGLAFSAALSNFVMSLRMRDFEVQLKYKKLSMWDTLTGLYNKQTCISLIRESFETGGASVRGTMMIIDLDNFKRINDDYGHYAGDVILSCMGRALNASFRTTDILGRFGGDEFLLFAAGLASENAVGKKCRILSLRFRRMVKEALKDEKIDVTCSVGAVVLRNREAEFDSVFRHADRALYEAKNSGRNAAMICQADTEDGAEPDESSMRKIRLD